MNSSVGPAPNWELDQLEVIMDEPESWQLVTAGPGAGKSAVACQRIAYLVDDGVPPSRILVVSFTRTAVAELRDRIVSYAVAGDQARSVRIATIDSHAWSLRVFDQEPVPKALDGGSYDQAIERIVELFQQKEPELLEFMGRLEHLIIDEAQDVVGIRAQLVLEMLSALPPTCGVSLLADPAQAIYGFTTDDDESSTALGSLLELLSSKSPRTFIERRLTKIHRTQQPSCLAVFHGTREELEGQPVISGHVDRVRARIREACGNDVGSTTHDNLAGFLGRAADSSTLVLFRRRADVLFASSFCSDAGVEHRLRVSGAPIVVSPWIGWLFGETADALMTRESFDQLWDRQANRAAASFVGHLRDDCWSVLHRMAAGRRPGTLDLVQLRHLIARSRPPVEFCAPECGVAGPVLGTIHASKGREADTVMLIMPSASAWDGQRESAVLEEGRVYYVGATRARKMLIVAANTMPPVSYLDSRRIFRNFGHGKVQLEVGRDGDVDKAAHFGWSNAADIQESLALSAGQTWPTEAITIPEQDYAMRLVLSRKTAAGVTRILQVGEMSETFKREFRRIWSIIDVDKALKPPPKLLHLYIAAVTTVGFTDEQRSALTPPYNRSGLGLAPIVKGFPTITFFHRRGRRDES